MARRDDHRHQLHYATILPATNGHQPIPHDSPAVRKQTELERAKALYVDFEDAFQDETTNHDYFGYQPQEKSSDEKSRQPANFYLQSIETISEVKNPNFSPLIRYQVSRENSRPSTPSDTTPNLSRFVTHRRDEQNSRSFSNEFSHLSLNRSTDQSDEPRPFSPDAIRIGMKTKQPFDDSLLISSEFKLILPQYFLVKYLGRTTCSQLWGAEAVRGPIDQMVSAARNLSSMNEIATLEASITTRGLTLTHRHSPIRTKHSTRNSSPERSQHGLIPLDYISYVMHDLKYSKIATCIVLRQSKTNETKTTNNDTVTECYAFLFQSKDHAHRFALSLAEAFNAQRRSSRSGRPHHHYDRREARSPPRRSKYRSSHNHHQRLRTAKYDDSYLRDSEV